ncbi:MAG: hypothetical protein C0482_05060 [Gordonia sp.]|nr:hypothetical protein [Gordonia sp. (in: high G+C Gram-positive bacteria)]
MYENEQAFESILPKNPGIYIWKLSLTPTESQQHDCIEYAKWLDELCALPHGKIVDRQLSHFLRIESIELRGRSMPQDKINFFAAFMKNSTNRKWMTRYLADLDRHVPALYVGETESLSSRAKDHISGHTVFSEQVKSELGLDWANLTLHYLSLGVNADQPQQSLTRKSLEYLTACITIGGYTKRPG